MLPKNSRTAKDNQDPPTRGKAYPVPGMLCHFRVNYYGSESCYTGTTAAPVPVHFGRTAYFVHFCGIQGRLNGSKSNIWKLKLKKSIA